jgi:carbon-monoxide dehydrogenase medium subunit
MKPVNFNYAQASDLQDTSRSLGDNDGNVKVLAGGQTLGPMMNLRLSRPDALIDISQLPQLREVHERSDLISFGAMITHAEIEDGLYPDPINGHMRTVASGIAYRVVRNKGTIGGSIAHADPAADWVNFLILCNATINVASATTTRQQNMTNFVLAAYTTTLQPDELITTINVPKTSDTVLFGYTKQQTVVF